MQIIIIGLWYLMPIKRSDAQQLVKCEKQLASEGESKSGNVMQYPMDSYICGIKTRSESSLILSDLLFA